MHSNLEKTMGLQLLFYGCIFLLHQIGQVTVKAEVCDSNGDLRLADRVTENEGRVEICLGGEWGTICDIQWGASDAKVACRQLGLPFDYAEEIFQFGGGSGPIHYSEFRCSGSETRLDNCVVNRIASLFEYPDCYHQQDAGIRCTDVPCVENSIRIDVWIVKVCHNRQWGFVCVREQTWYNNAARLVCDKVGHPTTIPRRLYTSLLNFDGPVIINDVRCRGMERHLVHCSTAGYGDYTSTCTRIAIAQCEVQDKCHVSNSIRLTQLSSNRIGRLEMCANGVWGSVCNGTMSSKDKFAVAKVVCRELNHAAGLVHTEMSLEVHLPTLVPIKRTNLKCFGNESSLAECSFEGPYGDRYCTHRNDIIVSCSARQCNETEVRLSNGSYGRLEICLNGLWGSVCDDKWDFRDAQVVCRQLQLDGPSFPLLSYPNYASNNTPIHLDDVHCNGTENYLSECRHRGVGINNCVRGIMDAGVVCTNVTCEDGRVHLVGGDDVSRGRVEYCYQGSWYSVCANGWNDRGQETRAVCQSLGYIYKSAVLNFGRGSNPILPFNFDCTIDDLQLSTCPKTKIDPSQCVDVAGVTCHAFCAEVGHTDCVECGKREKCGVYRNRTHYICNCYSDCYKYGDCCSDVLHVENCFVPECETGDVRLVGGVNNSTGRLEVCGNGLWGRVCDVLGYWGHDNARVICRQLGFSDQGSYVIEDEETIHMFGTSEKPHLVGEVHCVGTEPGWLECSHSFIGWHLCRPQHTPVPDIFISCQDDDSCEEGDVRLENGLSASNGRVEYCRHRSWGKVCSEDWGDSEAKVICKQLGYNPEDAEVMNIFSPENEKPVFLSGVKCSGTEDRIDECESTVGRINNCDPVGVICTKIKNPSWEGRVVGTAVGTAVGTVIAILFITACVVFGAMLLKYIKNRKKRQIERMTLDIMPINRETVQVNAQEQIYTVHHEEEQCLNNKPEENENLIHNKPANPNPYCEPVPAAAITSGNQGSFPKMNEGRTRLPSCQVRELTRGKFLVFYKDIILLECIGEGEFGIVYKARINKAKNNHREVAIKTLKGSFNKEEAERFLEESLKMSRFRQAHVMGLIGVCLDGGPAPLIIMPFMSNGSLLRYLKSHRETLVMSEENEEDEIHEVCKRLMAMCCQIASGMEYLAVEKYVHRDLAARNCMIDMNFLIKITDFGLSEDVFERNYFRQGSHEEMVRLPVKWMAPESLSDGHFSEKSDVWSYGVTMWEIFSGGKAPYPGIVLLTLIKSLEDGHRMPPPSNTACNDEIYGMMTKCWEISPAQRPSFKDIHSTISKYIGHIGGYLDMGVNPFNSMVGEKLGDQPVEASSAV